MQMNMNGTASESLSPNQASTGAKLRKRMIGSEAKMYAPRRWDGGNFRLSVNGFPCGLDLIQLMAGKTPSLTKFHL